MLIGTDGADLSPLLIDFLFINPGETFDVILVSNNTPGNYWIRVETTEVMDLNFVWKLFSYKSFIYISIVQKRHFITWISSSPSPNMVKSPYERNFLEPVINLYKIVHVFNFEISNLCRPEELIKERHHTLTQVPYQSFFGC